MFFLFLIFTLTLQAEHFLTYIIPCYNCSPWIEQAIDSIYAQENLQCPFEVICTDDGSTDDTLAVLFSLQKTHPTLAVFRHRENRGGGAARNTCVAHARGDLIFCLDADNVLVPNSVQALLEHHDQTGHDAIAFGGVEYFTGNLQTLGRLDYDTPDQTYNLKEIIQRANSPPWSGNYLFTRESYQRAGGYPEGLSIDTYAFGFKQILSGSTLAYVPHTFYWHRHGIESYYVRESQARRLQIHFFKFLLSHAQLFTERTIFLLRHHIHKAQIGAPFCDQIWFLEEKWIQLKNG